LLVDLSKDFQALASLTQPNPAAELPSKILVTSTPSSGKSDVGFAVGLRLGDSDGDFVGLVDGADVGFTLGSGGNNMPGNSTSANLRLFDVGFLVPGKVNLYSK